VLLEVLPPSVAESVAFELRSWAGRTLGRRLRVDPKSVAYLNLGAGDDRFEGYVRLDFFSRDPDIFGADLRHPLQIDDAVFDGIFTEHTLEHLTYAEVARLLRECRRILKPGGRIRIVLPDVSIFTERYVAKDDAWFEEWERVMLAPRGRTLRTKMEAISFVTQETGHRSAWDMESLEVHLRAAGFVDVSKKEFGVGDDPMLLRDKINPGRQLVSLYAEARAPSDDAGLPR